MSPPTPYDCLETGDSAPREPVGDKARAILRARRALAEVEIVPASPFAAANARAKASVGLAVDDDAFLAAWELRQAGSDIGDTRYRWDVSDRRCRLPAFARTPDMWRAFRVAEQPDLERDPFLFEERISLPILIAESCEYLEDLAAANAELGAIDRNAHARDIARALLEEADPVFRRDLAKFVLAAHPWTDTLALFCLSRTPRALERLRPLAVALATSYALLASRAGGVVLGARYPYHEKPLASATAHLAAGLWSLGLQVPLIGELMQSVCRFQGPNGGWGDAQGPEDVATTFVAADLLLHSDPSFDPEATTRYLLSQQGDDGLFRALGPEAPWFTAAIVQWLEDEDRSFPDRFRWPSVSEANLDRKTALPFFAYFDDLARLFAHVPGIATAPVALAFFDLVGFRAFNNRYGQELGDAVLAEFAAALRTLPRCRAIRDGGDEFLLVGAPGQAKLSNIVQAFCQAWPERFRRRFGDAAPPVAPRLVEIEAVGASLRGAREVLGRAIAAMKSSPSSMTPPRV